MSSTFRKTLLAVAVTGAALPAFAQTLTNETLTLTNDGMTQELAAFEGNVEVTGSYTGTDSDAIAINGSDFAGDLVLNATIESSGQFAGGFDMDVHEDLTDPMNPVYTSNTVGGSIINKGSITSTGDASSAMLIDPAVIAGSVINQGTLKAVGGTVVDGLDTEGVRALDIGSWSTTIGGDVSNTGNIIAEGEAATGIMISGSKIDGKLINSGLISAEGAAANAIDLTDFAAQRAKVPTVENTTAGTISATGVGSQAILVDGVAIDKISNAGTIQAEGTAINIEAFEKTPEGLAGNDFYLNIEHSAGLIAGGDAAINANNGLVNLNWTGGKIQGDILGLNGHVGVMGNATFDGERIEALEGVSVGNVSESLVGHLELLQPHTTIAGNLSVDGNSSLGMSLDSETDPETAVLSVTGQAAFGEGSKIKLGVKGTDFSTEGTTYKLVEANSITDDGLSVVSNSALLNVDSFTVDGTQIISQVTAKSLDQVAEMVASSGASGNAVAAASVFYSDVFRDMMQNNPSDPVAAAYLAAANDPAQQKKLAEQLAPENNGGATQAALSGQTLISNVTGSRTSGGRGLSSGDAFQEKGLWVQSLHSNATQDLRGGVAGYDARSNGIAFGADGKLNDKLTVGLAYSFLQSDVDSDGGNKTEVDGHGITLYSGYENGGYFVDSSLTYGVNSNESKRYIAGTTAEGEYDSDLFGINVVGGYGFNVGNGLLVEPRVAARYSNVKIDGYTEKGSGAALSIEDQRYEVAELGLGVRLAGSFDVAKGTLEPQAKLMAYRDFAEDRASSTSTFVQGATPFVTTGAKPVRDSYEAGVGVDYRIGDVVFGVSYDYIGKSAFDADTVQAKLRYEF